MSVLADFSIFPIGKGESLSPYVARCVQVVENSGLPHNLHAMGSEVEADSFEKVAAVIGQCIRELEGECNRLSVTIKLDIRKDHDGALSGKIASVREKMD